MGQRVGENRYEAQVSIKRKLKGKLHLIPPPRDNQYYSLCKCCNCVSFNCLSPFTDGKNKNKQKTGLKQVASFLSHPESSRQNMEDVRAFPQSEFIKNSHRVPPQILCCLSRRELEIESTRDLWPIWVKVSCSGGVKSRPELFRISSAAPGAFYDYDQNVLLRLLCVLCNWRSWLLPV